MWRVHRGRARSPRMPSGPPPRIRRTIPSYRPWGDRLQRAGPPGGPPTGTSPTALWPRRQSRRATAPLPVPSPWGTTPPQTLPCDARGGCTGALEQRRSGDHHRHNAWRDAGGQSTLRETPARPTRASRSGGPRAGRRRRRRRKGAAAAAKGAVRRTLPAGGWCRGAYYPARRSTRPTGRS